MENSKVSIVINTKNEEKNIRKCLESVKRQNFSSDKIEIIVVDNNSDDKTKEIAREYTDKLFNLGPERSTQRNYGVKISNGDFILFLDADMIMSENVVRSCVKRMETEPEIVGLYVREIVIGKKFWSRARQFERSFYEATPIDAVRFVRKSAFDAITGFDEKLYACEDWDLNKRLKKQGKFDLIQDPIYHNESAFSIHDYLDKKSYYILNMNVYLEKWGKNDKDIKKQFGIFYRYFWVFIENGKWKKVLFHPVMFIGIYYVKVLVGYRFLSKKDEIGEAIALQSASLEIKNDILVSVIITTKNEEKHIKNCLESIKKQSYPESQIEIIVVDNNSDDKTKEIAREYTDKVFDNGPERSAQRNFGVEKSSGEYIMYLDADMILSENVIRDCVSYSQNHKNTAGLYVSEIVMGKKYWSKVRQFERSFYDATAIDCVRFIKKDVFQKAGGFDENLTGPEDWDLDKKIRKAGRVALIKTPIFHNESEFNLMKYLGKKAYYSKKFDVYISKWGKRDKDVRKQFGIYYRYFGVFFEKGKWKKIVAHPFLAVGMYFLRFMVGVKYLTR